MILGRIQVNFNDTYTSDPAIPRMMSLPSVNLGNHRLWEPLSPYFDPWAPTDPHYPFDTTQETAFGLFGYPDPLLGPVYAETGEAKILPPLSAPAAIYGPDAYATIELLDLGIIGETALPEGSVAKLGKHSYHVKFDTCELGISGDQCGLVDFTIKPDGEHVSTFNGVRKDMFKTARPESQPIKKMRFSGEFVERSASVEGSVLGTPIYPEVSGTINEYKLVNTSKMY